MLFERKSGVPKPAHGTSCIYITEKQVLRLWSGVSCHVMWQSHTSVPPKPWYLCTVPTDCSLNVDWRVNVRSHVRSKYFGFQAREFLQ
jgi:hypothetical protein